MFVCCPKCGSRMLRVGKSRTVAEWWAALRGLHSLRCRDCQHQFRGRTLVLSDLKYARCPRCVRMDLNLWSAKEFAPTKWTSLLLTLGARRYRCEYCRLNFAGFRPRKEIFTFRRWARFGAKREEKPGGDADKRKAG